MPPLRWAVGLVLDLPHGEEASPAWEQFPGPHFRSLLEQDLCTHIHHSICSSSASHSLHSSLSRQELGEVLAGASADGVRTTIPKVLLGCRELPVPQGREDHPQRFPGQIIRSEPGFPEESQEYLSMTWRGVHSLERQELKRLQSPAGR